MNYNRYIIEELCKDFIMNIKVYNQHRIMQRSVPNKFCIYSWFHYFSNNSRTLLIDLVFMKMYRFFYKINY